MNDFIFNGQASGDVATRLLKNNFDVRVMRPFEENGRSYVDILRNGVEAPQMINNDNALLRKDEWIELDRTVMAAARPRLRVVADLLSRGLSYNVPNGMGKTVLQTQRQNDPGKAQLNMNPNVKAEADRPVYDLENLPLPVAHSDFFFNARELAASRNMGGGIDLTMAEAAGRRVSEEIEKLTLGVADSYTYGGGTVYGLTNFPDRATKVLTSPAAVGWTGATLVAEIIAMRAQLTAMFHYGPYMVYVSPGWDAYLDEDYSTLKGDNTLRDRIAKVQNISGIATADYLTGMQIIMVQMTSDVIRMVNGMSITTLQWSTNGGLELNFKVMAILVPQLRADFNGNGGIVHGSVP